MAELQREKLIKRVAEKTAASTVRWKKTSKAGTFSLTLQSFFMMLTEITPLPGTAGAIFGSKVPVYEFELLDAAGGKVWKLTTTDSPALFPTLYDLYGRAKEQAMGYDEATEKALKELG